ncbi:MAG TPA: LON peptidase substrate-binding domain-containing protein [Pseudonocardiaceae bacterium]|nr:LON peptidase substrate-binding domain-containing protein [Pseudonocardiaceae bacterium]
MAETIPIFPLATVLLPGTSLPLHIFEPRYRQLTMDLVKEVWPDKTFGVVCTKPGWAKADGELGDITEAGQLRQVGCAAVLREVKRLPDGRYDIVTTGDRRFRLLSVDATSAPYLLGEVQWLPDSAPPTRTAELLPRLADLARAAHRRYCDAAWQHEDWTEPPRDADFAVLGHLVAADCLLATEDRQRLLEEVCPATRLRTVRKLLAREAGILRELHAVPVPLSELRPRGCLN